MLFGLYMHTTEPENSHSTYQTLSDLYLDLRNDDCLSSCFPNNWERRVAEGSRKIRVRVRWMRLVRKRIRKWYAFADDSLHFCRPAWKGTTGNNRYQVGRALWCERQSARECLVCNPAALLCAFQHKSSAWVSDWVDLGSLVWVCAGVPPSR